MDEESKTPDVLGAQKLAALDITEPMDEAARLILHRPGHPLAVTYPTTFSPKEMELLRAVVERGFQRASGDTVPVVGIAQKLAASDNQDLKTLGMVNGKIDVLLQPIIAEFADLLKTLEGKTLGTLEQNREIAAVVQSTADRLGVLFRCPRCGESARFRCAENPTAKTGVFIFAHGKSTHGGTTSIPELKLAEPEKTEE